MIRELSSKIAKWLEQEGVISQEDKELFSYAIYSLLFGLLPIFIVTLLGLVFRMLREGLLMITPFMLIRKFSGGYHLASPKLCVLLSSILIAIALLTVKSVQTAGKTDILSLVVLISVVSLCICSPIDNDTKKLAEKERKAFRKITQVLSMMLLAFYFVLRVTVPLNYTGSLGVGILLAASLQYPCIMGRLTIMQKMGKK